MPSQLGRYRILKKLGAGGMGTVYLAEDSAIRRHVALKVPHFDASDGPGVIKRFLREAQVAGAIEHPHICPIYDVGEDHGSPYLVMPYIEGTPLAHQIDPERPWSVSRAVSLVQKLALAIEVMHHKGIIHRDLKPANVMIRTSGEPVLMDFGLARSASQRLTHTGQAVGTPAYMSPEQVEGTPEQMGPATDVYSLGVILFELLTGQVPFHGPLAAMWGQKLHGTTRPPSGERPGLDPLLDTLCLKAMAKKATERYASMTAFAQKLQEYLEQTLLTPTVPATGQRSVPARAEPSRAGVVCPSCGAILKLPAGSSARAVRCPQCQNALGLASPRRPLAEPLLAPPADPPLPATGSSRGSQTGPRCVSERAGASRQPRRKRWGLLLAAVGVCLLMLSWGPVRFWLGLDGSGTPSTTPTPNKASTIQGGEPALAKELTSSIGLKLVRISHGKFQMGSPRGEVGQFDREMPQHEVEISRSFYMGMYTVTVGQFRQFVQETEYKTEAEADGQGGYGYNAETKKWEGSKPQYTWRNVGWEQSDAHPVVNVSWNDAVKFCQWLSEKEKRRYELPTEAEWEYACRAGTTTRFYNGDRDEGLKEVANLADASLKAKLDTEFYKSWTFQTWDDGYAFTAPVGQLKPNAWGLYDMHGNVWQWCADGLRKYKEGYIKDSQSEIKDSRVLRGGSWNNAPRDCRAAYRFGRGPGVRNHNFGFRVVLRPAPRTP
jgi:LSD1 subclass zinc finger protein